jgi:hypothetical protein
MEGNGATLGELEAEPRAFLQLNSCLEEDHVVCNITTKVRAIVTQHTISVTLYQLNADSILSYAVYYGAKPIVPKFSF